MGDVVHVLPLRARSAVLLHPTASHCVEVVRYFGGWALVLTPKSQPERISVGWIYSGPREAVEVGNAWYATGFADEPDGWDRCVLPGWVITE